MRPDIPPEIARLSNRAANHMLAEARRVRLAAIDRYWAQCRADPDRAEQASVGAPQIVGDLFRLAHSTFPAPRPSTLENLSAATAQLLQVPAIRAALPDDALATPLADSADAFWEDGRVVALRMMDGVRVAVLRYDGPLFNPRTVPDSAISSSADCHIVCHAASDGNGGEYEYLTVHVVGSIDDDGEWRRACMGLAARSDLMRDLPAMEALMERGRLGEDWPDTCPLPEFPTDSDRLIEQLQAHKAVLRLQGSITAEQQALVDRRTRALYALAARLRRSLMEDVLLLIRRRIAHVEACALEAETGFARGDRIRHRFTGDEGTLEIVNFGNHAQFRLAGTGTYVTEDIRRGEWRTMM